MRSASESGLSLAITTKSILVLLFGPERPSHQPRHSLIERERSVEDRGDGLGDGQLDRLRMTARDERRRGFDTFRKRAARRKQRAAGLAASNREAEGIVARCRTGRGEHEIAET